MLALGFAGVFAEGLAGVFFVDCRLDAATFDLELGRGVRGLAELEGAIVIEV